MKLLMILLLIAGCTIYQGSAIRCYYCSNFAPDDPYPPYDPDCGAADYQNMDFMLEDPLTDACYTKISSDNGQVQRGLEPSHVNDGECDTFGAITRCYCVRNNCNTNTCQDCDREIK
ncbi:unnamed protein product [Meganyctiphanes norvegica]|uniref:Protein sleepless n=1 Tax=Meganyctiphanes norvegica TaxID=48144 RepID=A0AAV2R3K8_MEGNR